ncbi:glycosyltransferase [Pendulispora albinea]|uniref:Glycosyltransferase n=1 Tax=Pendulispora albinea TaxID=2741071 RepID=A0ABZ2M5X4_9BACT
MKIVIVTVGSLGDTAPYIGLGVRLRTAGHDVAIAAQEGFAERVHEAGLEFRLLPGDIRADLASENGQRLHQAGSWIQAAPAMMRLASKMFEDLAGGIAEAARGADLLLIHRIALMHGQFVAKAMGIPSMVLELFPSGIAPTSEFLPAVFGAGSLGSWGNRAVYQLLRASTEKSAKLIAKLQDFQKELGLAPITLAEFYRQMDLEQWPIYHGFSPTVVPRPKDWRPGLEIVGYFWPEHAPHWKPPAKLVDFLESGPAPVFIGFGSLVPGERERLAELIATAVRHAKVRAVVQAGWGSLAIDGATNGAHRDDVLSIGPVPHDWLFPQMAAVVHAGSAGITGAGLRAGVPAVPIPAMNDQPFWAERLVKLGVAPGALRFQKLSPARLSYFVQQAVTQPQHRQAAQRVAECIRTEDGAGRIVEAVERIAASN